MHVVNQFCQFLIVIAIAACIQGCGAPEDKSRAEQTSALPSNIAESAAPNPDGKTDDEGSADVLISRVELQKPNSGLETENSATKDFSRDEKSGALNVSFADLDLKSIYFGRPMTEDDFKRLPDWLMSLHGTKIKIHGYMYPQFDQTGIKSFILDHTTRYMNFGTDIHVYEIIEVELSAGSTIDATGARPIEVTGVFQLNPIIEDGKLIGLYSLKNAVVVEYKTQRNVR